MVAGKKVLRGIENHKLECLDFILQKGCFLIFVKLDLQFSFMKTFVIQIGLCSFRISDIGLSCFFVIQFGFARNFVLVFFFFCG